MSSGVAGMRTKMVRRWHWPVARSTLGLLSSCDWECSVAKWRPACGRNHDVGTGDRVQSLARLNLGHELEVFREVFREDFKQTIHSLSLCSSVSAGTEHTLSIRASRLPLSHSQPHFHDLQDGSDRADLGGWLMWGFHPKTVSHYDTWITVTLLTDSSRLLPCQTAA